jgi:hypothetical protein
VLASRQRRDAEEAARKARRDAPPREPTAEELRIAAERRTDMLRRLKERGLTRHAAQAVAAAATA